MNFTVPGHELTLKEACELFGALINRVKKKEGFIDWIHTTYCEGEECAKPVFVVDSINKLREIADHIKTKIPEGSVRTEKIIWPSSGHDADCGEKNTVHVDCFLYDDHAMQEMINAGKLKRKFCVDCGSRNIKDLNFISHSLAHCQEAATGFREVREKVLSKESPQVAVDVDECFGIFIGCYLCSQSRSSVQLEFIFTQLVPLKSQPEGFNVLDIGSRLGAVIYAASLYGCGKVSVTGVEQNEEFVKLQEEVIRGFSLQNVEVVCADVRAQPDLVSKADLIIMNNVFSFFMEAEEQAACFEFIHQHAKKGCLLIHNPEIENVLTHLKLSFTVNQWLEKIPTADDCEMFANGDKDVLSDCETLGFYRIRS